MYNGENYIVLRAQYDALYALAVAAAKDRSVDALKALADHVLIEETTCSSDS